MRLSPARFNRQLAEMGQPFAWRRAAMCPCRTSDTAGADPECPTCEGRGVFWGKAIAAFAGVIGAKASRAYADFGRWEDGDVLLSVPATTPMWGAGEGDRMLMTKGSEPFKVILTRDEMTRLPFVPERLERCFWLSPVTRIVIEASLPRVDSVTRALAWSDMDANAPDPGAQFSLMGTKKPEYFLFKDLPVSRAHFQGQALPKRMLLRKFDLWTAAGG